MDTEYPDNIYNPVVPFSHLSPVILLLKSNVDELKLIQVGITLSDANGNLLELVIEGEWFRVLWHGIDFERNLEFGIRSIDFGTNDIGYLLKILRGRNLPDSLDVFYDFVKTFFGGKLYDVKCLMRHFHNLHGGLDRVAGQLGLVWVATSGRFR
ncbi:hypothetical protein MTR67_000800 [Solanum verrucosum]|uniref:3'-5' exonuclease domain-containing protein n=1 Tax=Solanum verrucosum TaxID=315347 RepID=A0AAF0PP96_SOLVR|nr:hypothetical protein MTR67_000800 [Solanum verrucosum]